MIQVVIQAVFFIKKKGNLSFILIYKYFFYIYIYIYIYIKFQIMSPTPVVLPLGHTLFFISIRHL